MLTLRRAEGAKSKTSCLSNYRFGPFRLNASTSVARNGTLGFAFLQSTQLGCRPHDNITNWFELIFFCCLKAGLHKLWYPGIRDTSTWSKFGAHGEYGDVFLFSNLGAL